MGAELVGADGMGSRATTDAGRSAPRTGVGRFGFATVLAIAFACGADGAATLAQQAQPPAKKQTQPKATPPAAANPAGAETKAGGDGGLRSRIEQLEEQLTDIQVAIGTLESIAKSAGTASSSATFRGPPQAATAPSSSADAARADQLEVQVRALLQQIEQLTDRVRQLESGRAPSRAAAPAAAPAPAVAGFGTTTVTPAVPTPVPPAPPAKGSTSIGDLLQTDPATPAQKAAAAAAPQAGADGGSPKQLYEQAYGFLLAQDYPAAEAAFGDFLQKYPNDNLAGNAQYWLGETHFFRGQFKAAAAAYYKGYQTYARNAKAPDSLLKLALSLDKLGQKDAACQSFVELTAKFPNASAQIKSRAQTETQRIGCP